MIPAPEKLFDELFIFELANNHEGSVEHGLKIIDAMADIARKHGIKAGVKLQYRDLDTFIHPDFKQRDDVKHIPRLLSNRLTADQFLTLLDRIRSHGLMTIVTPFDEASVRLCVDHGVDVIKVASCSAGDWPLLQAIAETKKPVIASTAGLSVNEIDDLVSFFNHKETELAVLHCVALYPTPNNMVQLNFMQKMIGRYPALTIGYSGHEAPDNLDVVKAAVSKGARMLERHVGIPTNTSELNKYSMTPEQAEQWVAGALMAREISGQDDHKHISQEEKESLQSLQRGVFATKRIMQGTVIKRDDVFFAMPARPGQLTSGEFGRYRASFTASRDYEPNEGIHEAVEADNIRIMRTVVHDVKGMLHEAKVVLGRKPDIQLSHHHGLEHIRQYGNLTVNVVNREYCKKIIAILPGQIHPNHVHRRKEETFHLLWGDLEVTMADKVITMQPGDQVLVERGAWHSFTSRHGAIIEEVSTTHIKDDSHYEDKRIAALDPTERKTTLGEW